MNNIYYLTYEEPDLEKKFGEKYMEYKKLFPGGYPE
jgi:protein-S-isoprenylcysteine O-methyltransferase Ste14